MKNHKILALLKFLLSLAKKPVKFEPIKEELEPPFTAIYPELSPIYFVDTTGTLIMDIRVNAKHGSRQCPQDNIYYILFKISGSCLCRDGKTSRFIYETHKVTKK